jgi:hypothetical protein
VSAPEPAAWGTTNRMAFDSAACVAVDANTKMNVARISKKHRTALLLVVFISSLLP